MLSHQLCWQVASVRSIVALMPPWLQLLLDGSAHPTNSPAPPLAPLPQRGDGFLFSPVSGRPPVPRHWLLCSSTICVASSLSGVLSSVDLDGDRRGERGSHGESSPTGRIRGSRDEVLSRGYHCSRGGTWGHPRGRGRRELWVSLG